MKCPALLFGRFVLGGPDAQMAFAGARQAAGKGGTSSVTDEAGIGDKALRPVARKVIAAF
jgi:hypothetical protein